MADMDLEQERVTIQSFSQLPEAMLAKGMLDSAGIECFVVDDNTGRVLGVPNVIGGVRIQVNRADVEAAMALLEQPLPEGLEATGNGNDQPPRCPRCYSVEVAIQEREKPVTYTGAWLSVPLPVHEKIWECKSCGYRWDDEDNG